MACLSLGPRIIWRVLESSDSFRMDDVKMDTPSETLWEVVETLLRNGKEPLACHAFRWCTEYAFLCGLKNAPEPVVITKFEQSFRPLRFHLDSKLERSW